MGNLNSILQLINPDNTITANRALAHAIGMTETIIYSTLIAKYTYYESRDMLENGKWFYCTSVDLQESTTFTLRIQKTAIDNLEKLGLINVMVTGMPAKRYFTLNDDIELIRDLIEKGLEKSRQMSETLREKKRNANMRNRKKNEDFLAGSDENDDFCAVETDEETSKINRVNKMSTQEITKCQLKSAQNVDSGVNKMSSQEKTICRLRSEQNVDSRVYENASKSKDNKTRANETKSYQSIYLEKENVYFSPKYIESLVGCIAGGGTSEEATELVIRYGYEALADNSETVKLRRRIAENIDLERIILEQFAGRTIDMSKIEMVWEIYDLICDMVCNNQEGIKINRTVHDWEEVRGQFLKLGYVHVMNVTDRVLAEDSPKKNMRAYLISSLYNASMTELILTESKNRNRHRCISGDDIIAK